MKFRVTGDLKIAFVIEIEAENEESAEALVADMSPKKIEAEGSVEDLLTAGVVIDGCEAV